MDTLQILVALMFFSAILVGIAQRLHVPYPIALVLGGTAIGFIPGLPDITFDPNTILLVVLPPILYYASFGISFREFRKNWREIFSLSIALVVVTTVVVGYIFKWIFPQFPWALAFTFGAIVSPPDAIAATSILKRFKMGSRLLSILEGESLVNDASALVLYRMGIVALLSGTFSVSEGSWEFVKVVSGGIGIGLVLGLIIQRLASRYLQPAVGVLFSFTIPYITYIVADSLEVSGVLAVVVVGLIGSRVLLTHHSSLRRVLGYATWDIFVIMLNCFVFILIGLQLRTFTSTMTADKMWLYTGYALLISTAMMVVRMVWVFAKSGIAYIKALYQPRACENCPKIARDAAIIGWAGMRGIVSLTTALALPLTLRNGMPLEGREEIIFITFVVILMTLLIPGLTLPTLIRWLDVQDETDDDSEAHRVGKLLTKVADDQLSRLHAHENINDEEYNFLRTYFKLQRRVLFHTHPHGKMHSIELARLRVIQEQRRQLVAMWKRREIGDNLLAELEQLLDSEENHKARAELS